jgi:hypothetical protein
MALIYLATYPRSGNSMLQRILGANFWRLSAQVKIVPRSADAQAAPKGWEQTIAPSAPAGWPDPVVWNARTAIYRRAKEGEPWRRRLLDISSDELTEDFRRSLACEGEALFLKTHHLPFDSYFPGEAVIQVVRHPGPALWSYFRLLAQQALERDAKARFDLPPPTLDRVISGEVQFGGWSAYHERWAAAAESLGRRYLRLDFGALVDDQAQARRALSDFLDLPVSSQADVSFEAYQAKHQAHGVRGRDVGYERFYVRGQLERLWQAHGATAERMGFAAPDLGLAGAEAEQQARLQDLLQLAWSAAAAQST